MPSFRIPAEGSRRSFCSMATLRLVLLLAWSLYAAGISTEAELRSAILAGTGTHSLTADITLSGDLPALPGGSAFTLNGGNHSISGDGTYSLFKCPDNGTILELENLTLKNGFTSGHGAAVSSGQGIVVVQDIPGYGKIPIMIEGSKSNRVVLRSCVLKDNVSAKSGGAIFVHLEGDPGQPYMLIENSSIIGNAVLPGPGIPTFQVNAECNNGGAIWVRVQGYKSDVVIRNTTISGNSAPELGGAVLVGESAGPTREEMTVKVFNSTIVNNDCGLAGGAFWDDHSLLIDHSIVFGNSVRKNPAAPGANFGGPGPGLTIRWSDIGYMGDENGVSIERRAQYPAKGYASVFESNNLSADPMLSPFPVRLVAQGAGGPAYDAYVHVFEASSPAYNAGDPGLTMGQGTTPSWDQRGEPRKRIEAGRIDIGAYEFDTPIANTPPNLSAIGGIRILEDHTGRITFTVSDKETAPESLLVSLDRKTTSRLEFDSIEVNGGSRSIVVKPVRDYNTSADGPQTITVVVQDAMGASAKRAFTLEIDPVNDKPSLRSPGDTLGAAPGVAITHDFGFLGRVDKGDDSTQGLETAQRARFRLYDVSRGDFFRTLVLNAEDGTVSITPLANLSGKDTARVRFYLKDDGGTLAGGLDSSDLYSFIVVIRKAIDPPEKPTLLRASLPGLVSGTAIANAITLANPLLATDSMQGGVCMNCAGPAVEAALRQFQEGAPAAGFKPYLMSLQTNAPFKYDLKFYTTRGECFNEASGEMEEAALQRMRKDAWGVYTVHLNWWPISRDGAKAATGAYIVRGRISTLRPTVSGNPSSGVQDTLNRRIDISSIFGFLRR